MRYYLYVSDVDRSNFFVHRDPYLDGHMDEMTGESYGFHSVLEAVDQEDAVAQASEMLDPLNNGGN